MANALPPFPLIETPRLLLRELSEEDAPALLSFLGDAEAMRHVGTDALKDLREAQELINKYASWRTAPNPGVRWAIEAKASGRLIGTCGLFGWKREWCRCSTVYELANDSRGSGFMLEALSAAFAWGFSEMRLNRIEAQIHPSNAPSLRLAERLGFQREGLLREAAFWGGELKDLLQFGLLRKEWRNGGPFTQNNRS